MSHSLFFFLSVLSALEATQVRQCYQSQHYLTTFSGSTSSVILSRLPIACWFCCPPCLLASAALTFSHKLSTHANTHPLILQTTHDYMLHPACLRGSLLAISLLPPFIYLTFPLISSLHLLSLDFFLPLPNCHFSFFLLTQRLTLSFIWCSSSVMEEISFTTRAVQYWSFLAHKLDVTDLLSCWSIRAKEIDSTLSHSFTLALFLSLFSSSMLSLHLFPSLTVIKMQVVNMLIQ